MFSSGRLLVRFFNHCHFLEFSNILNSTIFFLLFYINWSTNTSFYRELKVKMHYFEDPPGDNPIYPCGICNRNIRQNHRYISCKICNYKVHIKCNETDEKTYNKMMKKRRNYVLY